MGTLLLVVSGCTTGRTGSADSSHAHATSAASSGTPVATPANAGFVYVANHDTNTVTIVKPDDSVTTVTVGATPEKFYAAVPGTTTAGTIYATSAVAAQPNGQPQPEGQTLSVIDAHGKVKIYPLDGIPGDLVIAPPGTPQAGTVYVGVLMDWTGSAPGSVFVLHPDGSTTTVPVPASPTSLVVADRGTPHAGTVYVGTRSDQPDTGTLTVINPDAANTTRQVPCGGPCLMLLIAPAGSPQAGSVYGFDGVDAVQKTMSIIGTGGQSSTKALPFNPFSEVMAPAGSPLAGTMYLTDNEQTAPQTLVVSPTGAFTTHPGFINVPKNLAQLGTLNGTVYYTTYTNGDPTTGGTLTADSADGTHRLLASWTGEDGQEYVDAIAPAGTPHAGTIYRAEEYAPWKLQAIASEGTITDITEFGGTAQLEVAPAGTSNSGTLYIEDHGDLSKITTDGVTKKLIAGDSQLDAPPILIAPAS